MTAVIFAKCSAKLLKGVQDWVSLMLIKAMKEKSIFRVRAEIAFPGLLTQLTRAPS